MLAFLVRCARVSVLFLNTFVTTVSQTAGRFEKWRTTFLEQGKVVHFAVAEVAGQHSLIVGAHNHLCFARVPLLFAAEVTPLFFWGRSTGVSVASTTITCHSISGALNAFLPAKAN